MTTMKVIKVRTTMQKRNGEGELYMQQGKLMFMIYSHHCGYSNTSVTVAYNDGESHGRLYGVNDDYENYPREYPDKKTQTIQAVHDAFRQAPEGMAAYEDAVILAIREYLDMPIPVEIGVSVGVSSESSVIKS